MELLPELSEAQVRFAHAYYPVFEQVKTAILLLSGVALLLDQHAAAAGDCAGVLAHARGAAAAAGADWEAFSCPPGLAADYQAVTAAVSEVSAAASGAAAWLDGSGRDTQVTDRLIGAYQSLRRLALGYWRLELAAESQHRH